ncbi:hypothetical protein SLA2020_193500 [Shorea laevis]
MSLYLYSTILMLLFYLGRSESSINVGHRVSLAVPVEYINGFNGRAFIMETDQMEPNFRAALSIEAMNEKYSCSLEVFLGDVKVWNSGHYLQFYTNDICLLELTKDGDLQLKGPKGKAGWWTGTSGQGVERLQILRTGNLVLLDALNRIKWQSFNFPTDVMLWGQRLDVATRLTSFPSNSSTFYTFEIQHNRVALYVNSGDLNYSYWEFKPSKDRNITFAELGSKGLLLFNEKHKKIAQILSQISQPVRFLALGNQTGNLGLYFYSPEMGRFEASFQALNRSCDLPLACKPYGICTFSNTCSCVRLLTKEDQNHEDLSSGCNEGISGGFCVKTPMETLEMLELNGVSSILRDAPRRVNVSKEECSNSCLDDCECAAAMYSSILQECFLYRMVVGVKQVERESGLSYLVKVPKGSQGNHSKHNVKKWVLVLVGVVDGLIILLVLGGVAYYLIRKRKRSSPIDNNT